MKTTFMAYVRRILSNRMFLNVYAEGQVDPNVEPKDEPEKKPEKKEDPKPSGNVNFEDLIAKARKEERDKLYPEITKLKEKHNDLLLVVADRDKELEQLKSDNAKLTGDLDKASKNIETGNAKSEKVSELSLTNSKLEQQLAQLQQKYDADINSLKLESVKEKAIAAAQGEIIAEMVGGNTEEEINASVEAAKNRYQEIQNNIMSRVQMPGSANPSATQVQLKDKTMDEIATMTPQEWAEHRRALGLR